MQTHTHTFTLWPNESSLKTHFSHWNWTGGLLQAGRRRKKERKEEEKGRGSGRCGGGGGGWSRE